MVTEKPSAVSSEVPKWWREKVVITSSAGDVPAGSPSSPLATMPPLGTCTLMFYKFIPLICNTFSYAPRSKLERRNFCTYCPQGCLIFYFSILNA